MDRSRPHLPLCPPQVLPCAPGELTLDELVRRLPAGGAGSPESQAPDDACALELFRRALAGQDQAAWQAVYARYAGLAAGWARQHEHGQLTGEEVDSFVNAAFTRLWWAAARPGSRLAFDRLNSLLAYLKLCVHSAIEDERRWRRDGYVAGQALPDSLSDGAISAEERLIRRDTAEALRSILFSRLHGEEERVVALLSWGYDLRPREILAQRPDLFESVRRVYQVKHNVMNRLRRDPHIQRLHGQRRAIAADRGA